MCKVSLQCATSNASSNFLAENRLWYKIQTAKKKSFNQEKVGESLVLIELCSCFSKSG